MDFYAILGVDKDVNAEDLKRAYRVAARKWHPDKNPENRTEAETTFRKVAEAYEILSDPHKRVVYDQYGLRGVQDLFTEGDLRSFQFADAIFRDMFSQAQAAFGDSLFGDSFFDLPNCCPFGGAAMGGMGSDACMGT